MELVRGEIAEGDEQRLRAFQLLAQFPDEIWTIIFEYLGGSSKDLLNCSRVCTKWARILKADQCTWLFDEVFPLVFPYLDKRDVLMSRHTGKRWRKVVDDFVENHESRLPFNERRSNIGHRTLYSILSKKNLKWNTFYEREHLVRFMELMGKTDANPIFGRSLWLEFQEESEDEDEYFRENSRFWPTVFQFLSVYGRQVWYFTIGTYGSKNTYSRFIHLLHNCLLHMPNLKSLHIFGWINESGDESENNLILDDIPAYLDSHPLPILPALETLEIDNMSGLPACVQDHLILQHYHQLKCLQISEWEQSRLVMDIRLPVLKELSVDVSRYRPMDKIGNLLTQFASSPLGKLSLSFSSLESTLEMTRLFQLIGNFSNTLRSLRLTVIPGVARGMRTEVTMNRLGRGKKPEPLKLVAPRLRALHLEGFDRLPLTFLRDLSTSLEYLELRPLSATVRQTCYPDETIDLYQYLHNNKLYDSNIWKDLPKLKAIYFEVCNSCERRFMDLCFTRRGYEYLEELKTAPSSSKAAYTLNQSQKLEQEKIE